MIIISDTHLGTQRQAGTTPFSQIALRAYIQDEFGGLIHGHSDDIVVINGDLFDGFTVDASELMDAHGTLAEFLTTGKHLVLGMGNHDWSPKADKVSSFHLLAYLLQQQFPEQVQVVDKGFTRIQRNPEVCMIPHMPNQDLFDVELAKAVELGKSGGEGYLLLHCNVMSPFAEQSDHSLNLSEGQLDALVEAGWTLVVGHEHQGKVYKSNKCVVPGNQIPTSVSDCLGNRYMKKYYAKLDLGLELIQCLDLDTIYAEVDWREITMRCDLDEKKFIRIVGDCSAEEAADMVSAVAKLRQKHPAFVIGNAVKVEGVAQMEGLAEMSMENISKFDVLEALLEELDEREREVVKGLLK